MKAKGLLRDFIVVASVLFTSAPLLSADKYLEDCASLKNKTTSKFCVMSTGFFYVLDDNEQGTWNYSLTEGEGLHEREVFLGLIKPNTCPSLSTNAENCGLNCCYCDLEVPLPRHPITNELIHPKGLTCQAYLNRQRDRYQSSARRVAHQCQLPGEHVGDPVTRLLFLCLSKNNLKQLEHAYNNPHNLTVDAYTKLAQQSRAKSSWKNTIRFNLKNGTEKRKRGSVQKLKTEGMVTSTPVPETTTPAILETDDQIQFLLYTNEQQQMDYVTVTAIPGVNLTAPILFSAESACLSRFRAWDVYPPCKYVITIDPSFGCSEIRQAINTTGIVIHHYGSSRKVTLRVEMEQLLPNENELEANETSEEEAFSPGSVQCEEIPTHARVTQVWAEGQHIYTLLSLEGIKFWLGTDSEIEITASRTQKVLSAKDYTGLSRFWAKFYFGDCLFRNCWRDLWNVLPEEFVQNLKDLEEHKVYQPGSRHLPYFRWDYFLPVFLLCFLLLVWSCTASYYETDCEFEWQ